jgi:hypothetical protein
LYINNNLTTRSSDASHSAYLFQCQQAYVPAYVEIVVNQEAVEWLMKANQEKHIGVATVVGKYRTGKSYILNRVLLNQNSGF